MHSRNRSARLPHEHWHSDAFGASGGSTPSMPNSSLCVPDMSMPSVPVMPVPSVPGIAGSLPALHGLGLMPGLGLPMPIIPPILPGPLPKCAPQCHLHQKHKDSCKFCKKHKESKNEVHPLSHMQLLMVPRLVPDDPAMKFTNDTMYNVNALLRDQILKSGFFKSLLDELHFTVESIIREVYNHVDNVEPYMTHSATEPSTFFCCLYRLFTLRLTSQQLRDVLNCQDNVYVRALGFIYMRYVFNCNMLWEWCQEYLFDSELFRSSPKAELGEIGVYVEKLILEDKYFDTMLPRLPQTAFRQKKSRFLALLNSQYRPRQRANMKILDDYSVGRKIEACSKGDWLDGEVSEIIDYGHRVVVKCTLEDGVEENIPLGMVILRDDPAVESEPAAERSEDDVSLNDRKRQREPSDDEAVKDDNGAKDKADSRDKADVKEKDPRESKESRDKDPRDRDPRESKESRDRDARDKEPRESKESRDRDARDKEPRESKETRDRDARDKEPRESKTRERDGKGREDERRRSRSRRGRRPEKGARRKGDVRKRSRSREREAPRAKAGEIDWTRCRGDMTEDQLQEYIATTSRNSALATGKDYAAKPQGYKAMLAMSRTNYGSEERRMTEEETFIRIERRKARYGDDGVPHRTVGERARTERQSMEEAHKKIIEKYSSGAASSKRFARGGADGGDMLRFG